jgi:prevent-host-death family protein
MKPLVVGIYEAKTNLSKLVKLASEGTEIVIAKGGDPIAKIVGYAPPAAPRKPGLLKGKIKIKPGFDELPPGFKEAFDA